MMHTRINLIDSSVAKIKLRTAFRRVIHLYIANELE